MAAPGENMRVNGDRLWDSLMEMAKIGPGIAGGNNRQTLTDADAEGRSLAALHRAALALKAGGVGYYPSPGFVHLDSGPVRHW